MKTIELNEQQIEFLNSLIKEELQREFISQKAKAVFNQILQKLNEE